MTPHVSRRMSSNMIIIYCRVPEGRGLYKTARTPGHDETRSVNTLNALRIYGLKPEGWTRPQAELQVDPAQGLQAQGLGRLYTD